MKLTDRAEEILEKLWTEVIEGGKTPDITVLADLPAFRELAEKGYISPGGKRLDHSKRDRGRKALCQEASSV